jgi:hypothetical protein
MLLDTIKRHDVQKTIRLLSVEALRAVGKLPSVIHSVPALMTPADKKVMFGKTVFDFLLLPGSGILLKSQESKSEASHGGIGSIDGEPSAFSLGSGSSDLFSPFAADDNAKVDDITFGDRLYTWTNFNDTTLSASLAPTNGSDVPYQEETRGKISLPDIEYIKQQRDMDLRGGEPVVNLANMPQATPTRIV